MSCPWSTENRANPVLRSHKTMQKDEIQVMKYRIRSKSGTSRLGFESGFFDEPASLSSSVVALFKEFMTFRHAYMPQTCPKCLSVCSKVTENDLRARCLEICENMSGTSRFSNMLIVSGLVKSRVENRLLNTGVWHMLFCILLVVSVLWFKTWQILRTENRDWQFLHLYRWMPLRTPHFIASRDPQLGQRKRLLIHGLSLIRWTVFI